MDKNTAKKLKLVLGVGVVLIFIAIGFSALDGFVSPYKTVSDVTTNQGDYVDRQIQVEGKIVEGSATWVPPLLKFGITDGKNQLKVRYEGVLPGSFPVSKTGDQSKIDVVVIGYMADTGEFMADQVLVKCPSKYEQKLNESSAN